MTVLSPLYTPWAVHDSPGVPVLLAFVLPPFCFVVLPELVVIHLGSEIAVQLTVFLTFQFSTSYPFLFLLAVFVLPSDHVFITIKSFCY